MGSAQLDAFRAQFPQYNDRSDGELAVALYQKSYSDRLPLIDYLSQLGLDRRQVLAEVSKSPTLDAYARDQITKPGKGESPEDAARRSGGVLQQRQVNPIEGTLRALGQGAMWGAGDEVTAAGAATLNGDPSQSWQDKYNTYLTREQQNVDDFRQQQPWLAYPAEILGAIGTSLLTPTAAGTIPRLIQMGMEGAGYGFAGTNGSLQDRAEGAKWGAGLGAAGGVLGDAVGKVISGTARRVASNAATKSAIAAAPSTGALKAASQASYGTVKNSGALVSQRALQALRTRTRALVQDEGLVTPDGNLADVYPKFNQAVATLDAYTRGPMSMDQAQIVAKSIRRAAKSSDEDERALSKKLLDEFESHMDSLPASAFVRGNGPQAVSDWTTARSQWARYKRTKAIDDAIEAARFHKYGIAAGVKSEFAKIARSPKKQQGFSADEVQAIKSIAAGAPLDDFLRYLQRGGPLPAYLLGHVATGGPVGGALAGGAKMLGNLGLRGASNRMAGNAASRVRAQVATPGGIPTPPPPVPWANIGGQIGVGVATGSNIDPLGGLMALMGAGKPIGAY